MTMCTRPSTASTGTTSTRFERPPYLLDKPELGVGRQRLEHEVTQPAAEPRTHHPLTRIGEQDQPQALLELRDTVRDGEPAGCLADREGEPGHRLDRHG